MSNQSKYKARKAHRLNGHNPQPRDNPHFYAEFMADFMLREKEQAEAARQGPLSTDPQRPWGCKKVNRFEVEEEEVVENKVSVA